MLFHSLRWRPVPVVVIAVVGLVMSACGGAGSPTPSAASAATTAGATGAAATAAAARTVDPLAPYPSKAGNLPTVRFGSGIEQLSTAPFTIARLMNFFEYQGVKAEFIELASGGPLNAVIGGSLDFDDSSSITMAAAVDKGLDIFAIQNSMMMTSQVCVSKAFAAKAGISPSDPIEKKMAGLKGAKVGISNPGTSSDLGIRFLLSKYGKLNPDTDTTIVQVGGASTAALDSGQVEVFLQGPPLCEAAKNGLWLVLTKEVPEFLNFTFEVVSGKKTWIVAHPDQAKAVATAVSMGNNFMLQHPDAALKLLQQHYKSVDPAIIASAFRGTILPNIPKDGKFTVPMWKNTADTILAAKMIAKAIDASEGVNWSNAYIGDASVK